MNIFLIVVGIFTAIVVPFIVVAIIEEEWFIPICVTVGAALSVYGVVGLVKDKEAECIQNKGSGSAVKESLAFETSDGCQVKKVIVSSCSESEKVYYVTNCKGVEWSEQNGKNYVQKTNMNK